MRGLTYLLQTFATVMMFAAFSLFYLRIDRGEYGASLIPIILFFCNLALFIWQWNIRKSIS